MLKIDLLLKQAQPTNPHQVRLLRDFSQLIHDQPEMLTQLAELVQSRLAKGNRAASVREAWERVRWDRRLNMPNTLAPFAARAVLYLHPELNGLVQFLTSEADEVFGTQPAPTKLPGDYARRLQWADGRPLTEPPMVRSDRKPVLSERPRQQELFREVA